MQGKCLNPCTISLAQASKFFNPVCQVDNVFHWAVVMFRNKDKCKTPNVITVSEQSFTFNQQLLLCVDETFSIIGTWP